jgi:spoIIIJ-associated protein
MTKVEAPTLEDAYTKASEALACSISELQCEVVQHPNKGIFGFLKKNAIIIASLKIDSRTERGKKENVSEDKLEDTIVKNAPDYLRVPGVEERVAQVVMESIKEEKRKPVVPTLKKDPIVDGFFDVVSRDTDLDKESVSYDELALIIETQLKKLIDLSCFDIDVVEVDIVDNKALIFLDGEDVALLIGKDGYRYNALSYMIFNWLHTKYELFIKLEIAEFLTTQEEMIRSYIQPVIVTVEKTGRAKTRFLDGILVQIALEQLREHFPNKYVAVKSSIDGKKFVVINEFSSKNNGQ